MTRAGIAPEQALSMEEALTLYTRSAESNGGDPEIRIREGDSANLTLLDSNVEGMHPALFRKVGVSATIGAGELVYSSAG
jgi:predicted amidohydrolase YtcJ